MLFMSLDFLPDYELLEERDGALSMFISQVLGIWLQVSNCLWN